MEKKRVLNYITVLELWFVLGVVTSTTYATKVWTSVRDGGLLTSQIIATLNVANAVNTYFNDRHERGDLHVSLGRTYSGEWLAIPQNPILVSAVQRATKARSPSKIVPDLWHVKVFYSKSISI